MFEQIEHVETYLKLNCINYKKDHKIKYETYFKTGGMIKLFIVPTTYKDFKNIVSFLNRENCDYKIIGFTSNILLLDEIDYSIIVSTKNLTNLEIISDIVSVEAGYSLQDFVRVSVINQSTGFEGLEGIPGSIGGAILMNAGAYGSVISDNLLSIECINENNELVTLQKNECDFSYRNSIFKNGKYSIISAKFQLKKGNRDEIEKKIETFHIARHSYQDFVYPNLGSMISLNGDIYNSFLKKHLIYNALFWILKYIYKNPLSKFINRKKPNNKVFNNLLIQFLKKEKNIDLNYRLSSKSANILINDGANNSKEIINYILMIHDLVDRKFHIENEIVLTPVFKIEKSFKKNYDIILKEIKERN